MITPSRKEKPLSIKRLSIPFSVLNPAKKLLPLINAVTVKISINAIGLIMPKSNADLMRESLETSNSQKTQAINEKNPTIVKPHREMEINAEPQF